MQEVELEESSNSYSDCTLWISAAIYVNTWLQFSTNSLWPLDGLPWCLACSFADWSSVALLVFDQEFRENLFWFLFWLSWLIKAILISENSVYKFLDNFPCIFSSSWKGFFYLSVLSCWVKSVPRATQMRNKCSQSKCNMPSWSEKCLWHILSSLLDLGV